VDHAPFPSPPADLSCHVDEALYLAMHVAIRLVPPVLAPFTRKDASPGSIPRHGWYWIPQQWQLLGLVQPCSSSGTCGEELFEKRGIDHTDGGLSIDDERDRHAEHREQMGVIDCAVQRVNTPRRLIVDEILLGRPFRVRLFSQESEFVSLSW
jgi:hypothetical protein